MNDFAITTTALTKQFNDLLAVDSVTLKVNRGELYGFLGLNGAGKSTTIRMLLGMIKPTSGVAEILGERVSADSRNWRRVGHLVEAPTAYPDLTVQENLDLARRLQGIEDKRVSERVIDFLGLSTYVRRKAKTLSSGNLQRLGLARALLHEPELLILDEPANGLDPAGVVEIRDLLHHLTRDQGVTILMSSHILSEVDRLATRIGIIHHGRLIEELDSDELERRRGRRLEVGAHDLETAKRTLCSAGFAPTMSTSTDGDTLIELSESNALESPDEVARLLFAAGVVPTRLAIIQEDLEQHFMHLTKEEKHEFI